jgi:PAS domain S-box-containing protein
MSRIEREMTRMMDVELGMLSPNEHEYMRIAALERYQILDTLPEAAFDRLTRLAARLCGAPFATINLIDRERQWTKSASDGLRPNPIPRALSFCTHTIEQNVVHMVPDTVADLRFTDNPLVTGPLAIRFYAGAPIRTHDGHNIGTICVMDRQPRTLSEEQTSALADLAAVVLDTLELRLQVAMQSALETEHTAMLQRVKASETKYRTLFEVLPMGVSITDAVGHLVEINPAAQILLGVDRDEHVRRGLDATAWQIIHPDGRPMTTEEVPALRALHTQTMVTDVGMGVVHEDDRTTWLNVSAAPIPLADYGVVAVYHDVTAIREAQRALTASEARFAAVFQLNPVAIGISTGANGEVLDVNERFLALLGRSRFRVDWPD